MTERIKKDIKIAIFDVDYTLISINSLPAFVFFIIKRYPKKILLLPYLILKGLIWLLRLISTDQVKNDWLILVKGLTDKEIDAESEAFVQKKLVPKIKPEALNIINQYRNKGYQIILASASFEIYIKFLAKYLEADYYFGTRIARQQHRLTTKIDGRNCKGQEKISRILKEIPFECLDKEASAAFSDSKTDLPFLQITHEFHLVHRWKWKILKVIK